MDSVTLEIGAGKFSRFAEQVATGLPGRLVTIVDRRGHPASPNIPIGPARITEAEVEDGKLRVTLQVTSLTGVLMKSAGCKEEDWGLRGLTI